MATTLAFDVYGTLIDTQGVVMHLETMMGDTAKQFSTTWREKQLEYSFRRGLMQNYVDFSICTKQALDYTCLFYGINLNDAQKQSLMAKYKTLPVFDDVVAGLEKLKAANVRLFAFSNGHADAVASLLESAGIRDYFDGIVSVDDIKSFKPNPGVYGHFLRKSGAVGSEAWLVSSNPFDVIGAVSAGIKGAWVQRSKEAIFDPWEIQPTLTISSFNELERLL